MPYWIFLFDALKPNSRVYVWRALRRACGEDWLDRCLALHEDGYVEMPLREFVELAKADNSRIYVAPEIPAIRPETLEKMLKKHGAIDIGLITRELGG